MAIENGMEDPPTEMTVAAALEGPTLEDVTVANLAGHHIYCTDKGNKVVIFNFLYRYSSRRFTG